MSWTENLPNAELRGTRVMPPGMILAALISFPSDLAANDLTTNSIYPAIVEDVTASTPPSVSPTAVRQHVEAINGISAGQAVLEIRRLSGLTWAEMATLLDISRRSLHSWANGASMSVENELHVRRALAVMRVLNTGEAAPVRDLLRAIDRDGTLTLDQLALDLGDGASTATWLGRTPPREIPHRPPLSEEEKARRRLNLSVADQMSLVDDAPLPEPNRARIAKTIRIGRRQG